MLCVVFLVVLVVVLVYLKGGRDSECAKEEELALDRL